MTPTGGKGSELSMHWTDVLSSSHSHTTSYICFSAFVSSTSQPSFKRSSGLPHAF